MPDLSLAGDWRLFDGAGAEIGPCPLPGDIHSALVAAGRIEDPMVGLAEADCQWVGDRVWELRRTVRITAAELKDRWPVLDLEWVDTFCEVLVNDREAASLASCFVRHRIDLSGRLHPGDNDIVLRFRPAAAEAHERAARLPFPVPWSVMNNRIADMNVIRKPQCHAGWDWGPCLMVAGVYGEPRLRLFDAARIDHAVIRQAHADDGRVTVTADVELAARDSVTVPVTFTFGGETATAVVAVSPVGGGRASLSVELADPPLWWPAGLGPQNLGGAVVAIPGDRVVRKVGLRRIELVNVPDAAGISMGFRVNGLDIFARGANWVPAHALPSRITADRIRRLLEEARTANMNMIRVWGGGFYEFDAFYDACDELGLLVWQDMMFSCSQYPSTPDFLETVDEEVRYQVKRLASHPSIALWCGDNEVIGSLTWYDLSRKNRDRYLVNYDRFGRAVERAVAASDGERAFWPSSPCSGALDYGDAWHDDSKGDMHFWAVWHEGKDFEHYYTVRPRFCSEFGFQSFPTMTAIRQFAAPEDWNAMSPVMEHHQRDRGGNGRIVETLTRYFRMPTGFRHFVYLSQLAQALAMETAVRFWRSLKPHCMGTLYWQLNDVWPAVSWSSLDHALAWKTLHHHARRFHAPVALSARIEDGRLLVFAVNDERAAVRLDLRIQRVALDGRVLGDETAGAMLPPDRAVPVADVAAPPGTGHVFVLDARRAGSVVFDPAMRLVVLPDKPKRYDLLPAAVTVEAAGRDAFAFSADHPAFFVRPEAETFSGAFEDASFLLLPGEKRVVRYRSFDGRMPAVGDVTVIHLADTWR